MLDTLKYHFMDMDYTYLNEDGDIVAEGMFKDDETAEKHGQALADQLQTEVQVLNSICYCQPAPASSSPTPPEPIM
jgi:hypothetical protein